MRCLCVSIALLAASVTYAEESSPDEAPLNYEATRGKPPDPMPAPDKWPVWKAFEAGEAKAPPFLQVEGYAHRKQRCTCFDVFLMPDGSHQARRTVYYRVGTFEDGSAAYEVDLQNEVFLALKVDLDVEGPRLVDGADPDRPSTWKPNVKAAWFGVAKAKPTELKVAAASETAAGPKDGKIVYHHATNVVVTGNAAVVCEPRLDWSALITIKDVYASDPLTSKPLNGALTVVRSASSSAILPDGRLLIVGGWKDRVALNSAEIFDPAKGTFTATGKCYSGHGQHTLAVCGDGRVLLVPGYGAPGKNPRPELFDPATGTWSLGPPTARECYCPVSVALADGRVLLYDGSYDADERPAEVFDPKTSTWSLTPKTAAVDTTTTLTRLPDGRVLMIGRGGPLGCNQIGTSIARLYDPAKNTWSVAEAPADVRCSHTATLLQDGRVLVAGGAFFKASAEIYDPGKNAWTPTEATATDRSGHAAVLLSDGRVLIIGGSFPMPSPPDLPIGEVFDPKTGHWSGAAKDADISDYPSAFALKDGSILVLSNEGRVSWFSVEK